MPPKNSKSGGRAALVKAVSTPLGFYVLILLVIEATLGLVLSCSKLSEEHVWRGFFVMIGLFLLDFLVVSLFVAFSPKNLLFGKEELANPTLQPSALRDQIEDLIAANVKAECLKKAE